MGCGRIDRGRSGSGISSPSRHSDCGRQAAQRHAKGADILYSFIGDGEAYPGRLRTAIQSAVADGADVINMSFALRRCGIFNGTWQCFASCDASTGDVWAGDFVNALNAGAALVGAAGNGYHPYGRWNCSSGFPALRPEVLSVGAVDTGDEDIAYSSAPIADYSSSGGLRIQLYGGSYTYISGIDLVAPGELSLFFVPPGNGYEDYPATGGSSIAAPVVTGNTALFRNALYAVGRGTPSARSLMVNMLVMGDGFSQEQGNVITNSGIDWVSGAGKVKMHWPTSTDLVLPWDWHFGAFLVKTGFDAVWRVAPSTGYVSTAATQFKWATLFMPANLSSVADIDFYLEDTCPPGGGVVLLAADTSYDIRSRFKLPASTIAGRCLQMRAHLYSGPPEGAVFYSAAYYHGGNTGTH